MVAEAMMVEAMMVEAMKELPEGPNQVGSKTNRKKRCTKSQNDVSPSHSKTPMT